MHCTETVKGPRYFSLTVRSIDTQHLI